MDKGFAVGIPGMVAKPRPEPYFSPCGVPEKVPKKIASSELGIERIIPEVQM